MLVTEIYVNSNLNIKISVTVHKFLFSLEDLLSISSLPFTHPHHNKNCI